MQLGKFLLTQTQARELCVITQGGWITATFFIDHEDLFVRYLHPELYNATVKSDHWDTLSIVSADGSRIEIPAHHIEVDL